MIPLNPLQLKLAAASAIAVLLALGSLTIWAFWERSGRLECKVDLVRAQDQVDVLARQLEAQTKAINDLGAITSRSRAELRKTVDLISAQHAQTRAEVRGLEDQLKAPTPKAADGRLFDCRDAIRIWREERRKVEAGGGR